MASNDPKERLQLVDPTSVASPSPGLRRGDRSRGLGVALGALLLGVLALSLWSRAELQARIRAYDAQVIELSGRLETLRSTLAERDRTIRAQQRRLGKVRSAVLDLRSLLDAPLEAGDRAAP